MDIISWLASVAIFWLVTVPMLTLLHELGHAAVGLATTRGAVIASIGNGREPFTIRLG